MSYFLQASETSLGMSTCGPTPPLFVTQKSVLVVGQRQKPSWCLQMTTTPVMPALFMVDTHWSQLGMDCGA